jgi:hypothetical protein
MMTSRFHCTSQSPGVALLATIMISAALMLPGCAGQKFLTEDIRGNIHRLEVEITEELPRVTLWLPSKGAASGAGRKAGKWAGNWAMTAGFVLGSGALSVPTVIITGAVAGAMLALTPVVAIAGAVKGAIESPSAESVESNEAQIQGILQAEDLLRRLQKQVLNQVTDRTEITILARPRAAATQGGEAGAIASRENLQPDSRLSIQFKSLNLLGAYEIDPLLALHLEAEVTLTALPALTPLYTRPFLFVTGAHRLSEWTAQDATLFTEALDLGLARLAELIVDDLFVTYRFVHERSDEGNRAFYKRNRQ